MAWQLQEAKSRFSEVVQRAASEGPQEVTVRGKRAAVVVSAEDYDRLAAPKQSFVDALLSGPAWDDELVELINDRQPFKPRDIEF